MALAPGTRLGVYDILAAIGEGGMGQVYRAHDTKLNRDVAIKVLLPEVADNPERLARFRREAQILASLNHPKIAHIYGLEESEGVVALVLELVEGETLADRIGRGPVPLDEALPIAKQIAEALEAAHEQGVIHRDLKPANIKVRPDGAVKLLDFGLAKALEPIGESAVSLAALSNSPTITSPALMTGVGVLVGTAAYMSPEQARGSAVDRRTDLWSLGVVIYEMLTGRCLFEGATVSDTVAYVLTRQPDWTALPSGTPPSIRRLLRRCLEKDRQRRLPDAVDVRLEIEDIGAGDDVVSPDQGKRSVGAWTAVLSWGIAVISLVTLGVAFAAARRSSVPPIAPVVRFSIPLGDSQVLTNTNDQLLALSPDGTQLVYVANRQLYRRLLSEPVARPIAGTDLGFTVRAPVFSPDGEFVAFFSNANTSTGGTLKKIPVGGGIADTLCPVAQPGGASWGREGIVFGQPKGIFRVPETGGQAELIVEAKDGEQLYSPQLLPAGDVVLFTVQGSGTEADPNGEEKGRVVVQSLRSGTRQTLVERASNGQYVATGHLVYASEGVMFAAPFDVARLALSQKPTPLIEGVARAMAGGNSPVAQFSVSRTGSVVYVAGPVNRASGFELAWLDRETSQIQSLHAPAGSYSTPRLSPDGQLIAVAAAQGQEWDVWIVDASAATAPRRLTFGGRNRFPVWSPDNTRVAFQSDRDGDTAIFAQRVDGTGSVERLTRPEQGTTHIPYSWSPDGRYLLFTAVKEDHAALWTLSMADHKETVIKGAESSELPNAVFAPDGRWVTYVLGTPRRNIFVQPFPPTGAVYQVSRSETGGSNPFWSPDGHELFFGRGPGDGVAVRVTTQPGFSVSNPVPVPWGDRSAAGDRREYDISRDGKRFLVVVPAGQTGASRPEIRVVLNLLGDPKAKAPTK